MLNEGIIKVLVLWPLYIVYMLLGALLFMELEQENEKSLAIHFKKMFQELNATRNVSNALMNDLSSVYREAMSVGINPMNPNYRSKWDFAGSFYFVGTVLTTIGFGMTAPMTLPGKVCFLLYALLGIPLNLLLFNTLLDQTVSIFTSILCGIYRYRRNKRTGLENLQSNRWEPTTVTIAVACFIVVVIVIFLAAPLFAVLEDWSFFESIYFLVVAFTTIGFGDFVPSAAHAGSGHNLTPHYRVGNWFVIIIGTIFTYTSMALMASLYKQCLERILEKCRKCFKRKTINRITASPSEPSTPVRERDPSMSPIRDERKRQMAVRALQTWRSAKKRNIGIVNQVEESILKTRRTVNNDDRAATGMDNLSFFRLDTGNSSIKAQTCVDDLNSLEVQLTKDFNQLIKDIELQRESLLKKTTANEERGIDNGVVIGVSSPESGDSAPLGSDEGGSTSVMLHHRM